MGEVRLALIFVKHQEAPNGMSNRNTRYLIKYRPVQLKGGLQG